MKAGRLQPLAHESHELGQSSEMDPRALHVVESGGRLVRHPDRDVEALTGSGNQVVRGRRSSPPLPDPEFLTRQGVKRVENLDVLGIRILV